MRQEEGEGGRRESTGVGGWGRRKRGRERAEEQEGKRKEWAVEEERQSAQALCSEVRERGQRPWAHSHLLVQTV